MRNNNLAYLMEKIKTTRTQYTLSSHLTLTRHNNKHLVSEIWWNNKVPPCIKLIFYLCHVIGLYYPNVYISIFIGCFVEYWLFQIFTKINLNFYRMLCKVLFFSDFCKIFVLNLYRVLCRILFFIRILKNINSNFYRML